MREKGTEIDHLVVLASLGNEATTTADQQERILAMARFLVSESVLKDVHTDCF